MSVGLRTHELQFDGGILQRGFGLYVLEVMPPKGDTLYYVCRTGDSSSTNAQSPFNRMGQHLGFAKNSSMLRRHLVQHEAKPEQCTFRLVALGPILKESKADIHPSMLIYLSERSGSTLSGHLSGGVPP